ncbi:hypothetical protein BDR04DRAFT_18389 [Suillus decipiens]|nr:hypothetical protein BDR04DRAFT_18389 [Suillus decipiens]
MALPFSPLTSVPGHGPTPTPTPTPTSTPTLTPTSAPSVVTTTLLDTQSSTTTSSSSSYASTTSTSSSSSSHKGLSTGAQTGISLGIVFFLILCVLVFYNLKRLYQRAREKGDNQPALPMSEVSQYLPPKSVASPGGNPPPPPPSSSRPGTTYPDSADISSAAPLLSHNSHRNSYPVSTQNRYSTLSQTTDPHQIVTQDLPTFPNPHDPFTAPVRTASCHSLTHSTPHDASAGAAMMATSDVLAVGSSSNSQSERRLSVLHADMTRYQKELESEHKRSLEQGQELHDPPPQYPS